MDKLFEHPKLLAQFGVATARRLVLAQSTCRMLRGKRIVQMAEQSAASNDAIPRFRAINKVGLTTKTGFVVTNNLVQLIVPRHRLGGIRMMIVENGNGGMGIANVQSL